MVGPHRATCETNDVTVVSGAYAIKVVSVCTPLCTYLEPLGVAPLTIYINPDKAARVVSTELIGGRLHLL